MSNKKPKEINSIFEEIIQEWIGQGRSEEQIYGVRNFFTGIGGIKLKTLLQEKEKEMLRNLNNIFMRKEKPKKIEDWEKKFDELLFPECPTEEEEPFFWRWKNSGRATLITFIKTLLQEKEKEMKIEIQYWKDLWVEEKQLKKPKK